MCNWCTVCLLLLFFPCANEIIYPPQRVNPEMQGRTRKTLASFACTLLNRSLIEWVNLKIHTLIQNNTNDSNVNNIWKISWKKTIKRWTEKMSTAAIWCTITTLFDWQPEGMSSESAVYFITLCTLCLVKVSIYYLTQICNFNCIVNLEVYK